MSDPTELTLDIPSALGAEPSYSTLSISIYVPNKDKGGVLIADQRQWVEEAIRLLCEVNGGATAMPPVDGGWLADDGRIIRENPIVVYSYIRPEPFVANLPRVREFIHRLGRLTNQGEIAIEFAGQFFRIRQFDAPKEGASQ